MPIHDYRCPEDGCAQAERDFFFSATVGIEKPSCPEHQVPMVVDYSASTRRNRTGRQTFEPVEVEGFDGKMVKLESLQAIRRFEAESIKRGQPQIFRNFTQDRSNKDVNTMGKVEHPKFRTTSKRGVPYVTPGPPIHLDPRDLE